MKKKTFVKSGNGFSTGNYNINTYNPLDSVISFSIAIVVMLVISIIFNFALYQYEIYNGNYSYFFVSLLSTLITQFAIFLVAFIFSKVRHVNYLSGGGFTFRFDWVNIFFASMLIIGVDLLLSAVHTEFGDNLLRVFGSSMNDFNSGVPTEVQGLDLFFAYIQMYILVPLLPCIFEEGLFRGVILRGLSQFGKMFAIIVSALMFSFMHGNPVQILLQFIFGLLVGSVVMLTRNFAVGCVMHFISNYMVVRLVVLANIADQIMFGGLYLYNALATIIGTIFLIVSVIYFIKLYLSKYKREVLNKPEKQTFHDLIKFTFVETDELDENGDKVYKKVYWNEIAVGDYSLAGKSFSYKGNTYKANKPTKKLLLSKILIIVSLIIAFALIFI